MNVKLVVFCCYVLIFVISCVSVFFTGSFMLILGGDDDVLKITFTILGVSLDLTKHVLPIVICLAFLKRSYLFAVTVTVFYVILAGFSFISSASAIEGRIDNILKSNDKNSAISTQINLLERESEQKSVLFLSQKSAGQITKMNQTSLDISLINTRIVELMSLTVPSAQTVVSSSKTEIIYIGAFLIELARLFLMASVRELNKNVATRSIPSLENKGEPKDYMSKSDNIHYKPMEPVMPSYAFALKMITEQEHVIGINDDNVIKEDNYMVSLKLTSTEDDEPDVLTMEKLRQDICNRVISPTVRSICSKYKVKREHIRSLLNSLAEEGVLVKGVNNRFSFA